MADLVRRDFGDMERWQGPSSLLADAVEQNALLRRLEEFEFETVQVDASGTIVQRATKTARHYLEPLGEGLALDMVYIPGGDFRIGAPATEEGYEPREGPQHCVDVPDFCLGRYPVTQGQWRAVVALPQVEREVETDPSYFKGDNYPVETVSWYDAMEFCARLSAHTGRQYRLPTEAEWEYACRAGTTTPFHFGKTITTELANYRGADNKIYKLSGSYGDGPIGEYRKETTPVNQFEGANAFGLCDMHGNVWEWCQDP